MSQRSTVDAIIAKSSSLRPSESKQKNTEPQLKTLKKLRANQHEQLAINLCPEQAPTGAAFVVISIQPGTLNDYSL